MTYINWLNIVVLGRVVVKTQNFILGFRQMRHYWTFFSSLMCTAQYSFSDDKHTEIFYLEILQYCPDFLNERQLLTSISFFKSLLKE